MSFKYTDLIETIRIKESEITIHIVAVSFQEGDFFVVASPSLNVSGYGKSEEDAKESFNHNLALFCEDIQGLQLPKRVEVLQELGFIKPSLRKKNFQRAYIENESLSSNPDRTNFKTSILQANING